MVSSPRVAIVIPALDEEAALPLVLRDVSRVAVSQVVVVDNGSRDGTCEAARAGGATVLREPRRGYGAACLAGIRHLAGQSGRARPEIVVFLDADHSDHPEEMAALLLQQLAPVRMVRLEIRKPAYCADQSPPPRGDLIASRQT